ncbi:Probable ABC-type iron(III)-transport system, permease component [Flavobacterium indicum GPTSA100-9 = DSM 17447]|uniref:Probable ABC-type iron(III)-transport system, permease component n=1 Tax=Flavobacterium indicum (strain DSM 17447 / CIP 109464 / GPTSA100-9) TaxID=1094466 RepID=H8XUA4_FLAIG|nr:Probable ABC-type iron(III)-transport system, permease component [Flavobacterium indicum GPTSA100-9 = DSM 17447]
MVLLFAFLANLALGNVLIPWSDVCEILFNQTHEKQTWSYIVLNYRFPKAFVAIVTGMGLSLSGLIMQTLFRNPLAGPYVLGLSSGASLGVAMVIMGSFLLPDFIAPLIVNDFGILIGAFSGSLLVLLLVFFVASKIKDTMSILIVGLMFSSLTSAIINVLTSFSSAEQLQKFTFWTLGSLGNLTSFQVYLLSAIIGLGIVISFTIIKPLDGLLLGENYARSLGISIKRTRNISIIATSILAGTITAFVGPIAFIGLAIPHVSKLIFQTSNHKTLFIATLLLGAITMLVCDTLSQMPNQNFTIPINAITSILGAPVVIWLIIRKKGIR